ncbi:MAG: hypothetical protein QOE51_3164 [Actinoplanes sp.]|nr:hypothetical protein [Actinoplanes sp.]
MEPELSTGPAAVDRSQAPQADKGSATLPILTVWCYFIAAVVLTGGLWQDPAGRQISGNPGDTNLYQWWLGWWVHAISVAHNPFFTDAMNLPVGISLMSNTSMPLPALLMSWLTASAGPLVTYNVLITLAPVLTASAMMFCLLRFGISQPAAAVAGAVFGFAPAIVQSMLGHLSMSMAFLLPVIVSLSLLAWKTMKERRDGLILGAVGFAQLMIGEEVLFQSAFAAMVALIVLAVSRPAAMRAALPVALRTYAWAFGAFILLAGYPLYAQLLGHLRVHGSPFWVDYYAADLTSFTTPSELVWNGPAPQSASLPGGPPEHLIFLGVPLFLTCIAVIVMRFSDLRTRVSGVGFVVFAILSLGGSLWVRGQHTTLALPYHYLEHVPLIEGALPSRLGVLTAMFAAVLMALALDFLGAHAHSRVRVIAATGIVLAVIATLLPKQLPVERVPQIPRYFSTEARKLPEGTNALVVPIPTPLRTEPLRWQAAAQYRYSTPDGYFIAPAPDGRAAIGVQPGPTEQLFVKLEDNGLMPAMTPELTESVTAQLDAWGITTVLLGPSQHREEQLQLLTQLLGGPSRTVDDVSIWTRA